MIESWPDVVFLLPVHSGLTELQIASNEVMKINRMEKATLFSTQALTILPRSLV
jgi:hypothetical protein